MGRGNERTRGVGGVSKKLQEEGFMNWLMPHVNDKDLEQIVANTGDKSKQMEVLNRIFERAELPESFTGDFYQTEKEEILTKLERRVADENPDLIKKANKRQMGIGEVSETDEEPEKVRTSEITQHSKSGKLYTRSYTRWSFKEELFLKSRSRDFQSGKIKMSDMRDSLRGVSGNERTSGSIRAKMKRLNKEDMRENELG